ncbi:MAG TPA: tetratricopeptide repeat protein, partial [Candidatus Kapabacteria bacterium]|nr:tetratricopeptide repeat protein [Candidatus Kapabacteria bacterium]
MPRQRAIIGEKLFHFLDGTEHHFQQALEKAHRKGTSLFFYLHTCKETANWPFELLAKDGIFLLPEKLHLIRYIPGKIKEKTKAILPKNRPLKLLFMACSVMDTQPELDFEKEEEAIFHITEELPIEMDVEDSGSLPGLLEKLNRQSYDIIHLSGHAGVDQDGQPYFVMEDETGGEHQVFPDRLWNEALIKNPPRLIILSGSPVANMRALSNTSAHEIKRPFAHILVEKYNIPAVLEWNLKVNDEQAILAGKMIYLELSKGCSIFEAVQRARHELSIKFFHHVKAAWPLLKLYASAVPLNGLVRKEQNYSPKTRRMKHIYLKNSRVKVLEDGFVGRRRQLQQSLRGLKTGTGKVGLLIMGTGGLGKSCLAGKISERFSSHTLIIIQGKFNTLSLNDGLKDAFIISQDEKGKSILAQAIEMKDKLIHLCTTCFKERNYLFLLDDFEKNMEGFEKGEPGDLFTEAADLLGVLLHYLPFCDNKSQIIITSRYEFSLPYQERDIIDSQLEKIWLTGFTKNEQRKKLPALSNISKLENREIAGQLLAAGYGNPRLMEWIDILTKQLKINEVETLAAVIKDKQEEFIRAHIIRELLKKGGVSLGRFLQWFSIYRIPVFEDGVFIVAKKARIKDWKKLLRKGMSLSLAEHDQARKSFQVTPLLREELLKGIKNHLPCHKAGFTYFKKICEAREVIDPVLTEEWIYHALGCKEEEVSSRQAGRLVEYLRNMLAFQESRRVGLWVLNEKKLKLHAKYDSFLLNEFAYTIDFLGEHKKAISYYQQALVIDLELFGEKHPNVAIRLSNMGEAWRLLGDAKKAIGFYVKALVIDRELLGEKHPNVAVRLHNIGSAWYELDEFRQSVGYYEQAKNIWENFYGENHQNVATVIINLGEAWRMIGDIEKAINYYKKGLAIFIKVYGEEHQDVAAALKKLGTIYDDLGEYYQSIGYYEQAYFIHMSILGERHPDVAADL